MTHVNGDMADGQRGFSSLWKPRVLIIAYFSFCMVVALPFISAVYGILYANDLPSGADPNDHSVFILRILLTKNVLVPYTQFLGISHDAGLGYYPTFLHMIVAAVFLITGLPIEAINVIHVLQGFMFIQYLIGVVGYSILIKSILDQTISYDQNLKRWVAGLKPRRIIYFALLVFAFGLFIYCTPPIIKTFRDGGYGEILAMWCMFPFYIYFLINKRWFKAALLLAAICATHNLAFIMSVISTLSYFVSMLVSRDFNTFKKIWKFVLLFVLLSFPSILLFYVPTLTLSAKNQTGSTAGFSRQDVMREITPNLFYVGLVMTFLVLWINHRTLGWIAGWSGMYLLLSNSSLFVERFVRELTIPLGITVGICSALLVLKVTNIVQAKAPKLSAFPLIASLITIAIILPVTYLYFSPSLNQHSNTTILNYYSPAFAETNKYFLDQNNLADAAKNDTNKPKIANFGMNQWIKPFSYGSFVSLEIMPADDEKYLSVSDRSINSELRDLLSSNGYAIANKYNVKYVTVNGILNDRWYPESYYKENNILQSTKIPSYLKLVKEISDKDGQVIRIFSPR